MKNFFLALVSGVLLVLCFPYPDAWWLAYVALIPLLVALEAEGAGRAALLGLTSGAIFFGGVGYWVAIYGVVPFVLITLIPSLIMAVFGALYSVMARRLALSLLLLTAPALWTSLEFLRSELGSWSFSYGVLGYSQHGVGPVLQLAGLLGVYGISFWLVLINVGLAGLVVHARRWSVHKRCAVLGVVVAAVVLVPAYGLARQSSFREDAGPAARVAAVQASIPQSLKYQADKAPGIMEVYGRLVTKLGAERPELVVMPEATIPIYVPEDDPLVRQARRWPALAGAPVLVGVPTIGADDLSHNTARLFDLAGKQTGRYDKIYPVPFGEFVPLRAVSESLWTDFTSRGDVAPGDVATVFRLGPGRRFGVLICSESMYAHLARRVTAAGADVLLVVTNDAWFHRTSEADQHFAMSVVRAVENGRWLVQAANSGVSGLVDPTGRVTGRTKVFQRTYLSGTVRFRSDKTFYAAGGWLFPYGTIIVSLAALGLLIIFRRSSDN